MLDLKLIRYNQINIPNLGTFVNFALMRFIAKGTLPGFLAEHADSEQALKSWYQETEKSLWKHPNDLKSEYPSASILAGDRVVFNIKGNSYRLVVKINYRHRMVWIRFIGTHAESDKINSTTI